MQFSIKQIVREHVTDEKHMISDEELQHALIGADVEKMETRITLLLEQFDSALRVKNTGNSFRSMAPANTIVY